MNTILVQDLTAESAGSHLARNRMLWGNAHRGGFETRDEYEIVAEVFSYARV